MEFLKVPELREKLKNFKKEGKFKTNFTRDRFLLCLEKKEFVERKNNHELYKQKCKKTKNKVNIICQ